MRPPEADKPARQSADGAADATAAGVGIHPSSVRAILCDRDRADARSRLPAIVGSPSGQPILFAAWYYAAPDAVRSVIRWRRPSSVAADTRLKPSFLRTTPARKPRTECCCHPVACIMATMLTPLGARSIARMRPCLGSVRSVCFAEDGCG